MPKFFGYESEPDAEEHATQVELHLAVGAVEFGREFAVVFARGPVGHGEDGEEPGEGEDPDGVGDEGLPVDEGHS